MNTNQQHQIIAESEERLQSALYDNRPLTQAETVNLIYDLSVVRLQLERQLKQPKRSILARILIFMGKKRKSI